MTNTALDITESRTGQVCIVSLSGRINSSNVGDLSNRINSLIAGGEKNILLDFGSVLYLTSAAFRALLVATDEAERNAARFVLCSVVGHVRELFENGGLLEVFTIHASREEALARLG
jgi:anti-anti-sigma factor